MKIGIYVEHLYTAGGGEKHIGVVGEALSKKYEVEFITFKKVDLLAIGTKLNLDFSRIKVRYLEQQNYELIDNLTKEYDVFINATIFAPIFNKANIGIAMIYFPIVLTFRYPIWIKRIICNILNIFLIFRIRLNIILRIYNKQKLSLRKIDYLKSYSTIWSNSQYTHGWIKRLYNLDNDILYPPVDINEFIGGKKDNIILSVGRFFPPLYGHNKKQLEMIQFFKEAYDNNIILKQYEYHLCGGLKEEGADKDYFNKCVNEAKGYPIFLHPNISFIELKKLYSKSKVFWHASGYGEDPEKTPEVFEHFGITTVEAMAAGVIPVVIGLGGQPEIVKEADNGYLWLTKSEIIEKTINLIRNSALSLKLSQNAIKSSKIYSKLETLKQLKKYLLNLKISL